jgi:hypothetical protein
MTTETNNEKEKQQKDECLNEQEKKFIELSIKANEQIMENYNEIYEQIAELLYEFSKEILNEYINKNFKYVKGDIAIRNKSKLSNKWILLITVLYRGKVIEYDKEKKKFIIHL